MTASPPPSAPGPLSFAYPLEHRTHRPLLRGSFEPLGATLGPDGVNFALHSAYAEEVYLLLFDQPQAPPTDIIRVQSRTRQIWHVLVHGLKPGQLYGYKVKGPWDPARGLRFNPHKLLVDPYARALSHPFRNTEGLLYDHDPRSPDRAVADTRDNTGLVPKALVLDPAFDWKGDEAPRIPAEETLLYEVHVKGFTAHPSARVRSPGTYLGFIEKIPHLKELGVNAVELLPVHEFYHEDFLVGRGLVNYWGYNSACYFAPALAYAENPGRVVTEFKTLVRELHRAGIEVILDVVYNHTGEGNEAGPSLSLKGIDNPSYYLLSEGQDLPPVGTPRESQGPLQYLDFTGCGNSVNLESWPALRLVMDSLRYWVSEMHVDGFRFDLATVLGREKGRYMPMAAFFAAVAQDPVLQKVKLIAEPWDMRTYQLGNFPPEWGEWNGRFRDTVRRFVRGDGDQVRQLASGLAGSSDLFGEDGRAPSQSVNFVTCHDGFTLRDLVSFGKKHNERNGENNRDGADENFSSNHGFEGLEEDGDPEGLGALRRRQAKNLLCHLFLSLGTPMLLGGDEFFRTQEGNNNAYCQDNALSWIDWSLKEKERGLFRFVQRLIRLRKVHGVFLRRHFLKGKKRGSEDIGGPVPQDGASPAPRPQLAASAARKPEDFTDILWFGRGLDQPAWHDPAVKTLCYLLDGRAAISRPGDYALYVICHADASPFAAELPQVDGKSWYRLLDTALPEGEDILEVGREKPLSEPFRYEAAPQSTVVLLAR